MALNLLLTRIDNRLVHGQVGLTWTRTIGANLIVVVDDFAATDEMQQNLMTMTAENSGVDIRFFSVEKTINVINKASDSQKIFIVCKTPDVVRKLIDGGIEIKELNVGNMHQSDDKKQYTAKVFLDEKDIEDLLYIDSKGVNIYFQDVPGVTKYNIDIIK